MCDRSELSRRVHPAGTHEPLERRLLMAAVPISDFSPPDSGLGGEKLTLGAAQYYAFNDGVRGYELWRADAASPDGRLVRDINPTLLDGSARTGSSHPAAFFALGNLALFIADDGISGRELWRTDGTAAGTFRLIESRIGYAGIATGIDIEFASFKGGAVIVAGADILYTDGTIAGSRMVDRITDVKLFAAGQVVYWLDGSRRNVRSFDGTNTSTVYTLPAGLTYGGQELLIDGQGQLVLEWYTHSPTGRQSDSRIIAMGAAELSRQSVPHPQVGVAPQIGEQLGTFNGRVFHSIPGRGLFATDGTAAGLRQLLPAAAGRPQALLGTDKRAYFTLADLATNRRGLWSTDGTPGGTRFIAQIDTQDRPNPGGEAIASLGEKVIVAARAHGRWEVRAFNGDGSGSELLAATSSGDIEMTVEAGQLFFRLLDMQAHEGSFYRSDGTPAGTTLLSRRSGWASSGAPEYRLNVLAGRLVIVPASGYLDQVLDPSSVFTVPGPPASTHRFVQSVPVGGRLFLRFEEAVANGPPTMELWRTDGTAAGTIRLIDLPHQSAVQFMPFGNLLLFGANGFDGNEIYRSDGTKNGTYRLRDIHATGDSNPLLLGATAGTGFFIADDGINGPSLWKTDGLYFGTVLIKSFGGRLDRASISQTTSIGDAIYFVADDGIHGRQLWRSDGTSAGTFIVKAGPVTGSQLTSAPLRAGNGLLVASGFTPADGAEIFALSVSSPAMRPITAPYIKNRQLHVFGSDSNDVIRAVPRSSGGGRSFDLLEVLVNDAIYIHRLDEFSVLRIFAGSGDDLVDAGDVSINTSVIGGSGNDTIRTGAGRDTIYGGDGNDALYGGANTDWLFGGAGDDRLAGGGGRDILWGGPGRDTFLSSLAPERRDFDLDDLLR